MASPPARPDILRGTSPDRHALLRALPWIAVMAVVGIVALEAVVHVHDGSAERPPSSLFVAGGLVVSVVSLITVTIAARVTGVRTRAAVALGGAFAAIAIAKFTLGPIGFFRDVASHEIQDPLELGNDGTIWAIALVVGVLYAGVVILLAALLRPREAGTPRPSSGVALIAVAVGAMVVGAVVTPAPLDYVTTALSGVGAASLAIVLLVAAALIAASFHDAAEQTRALGTTSVYLSLAWVAVAFVLVFQVLWVVFLLAVVTLWPLRTVTPK
jgi:hypothetical protein